MRNVIEKEAAEAELQRIVDLFEVDPEGGTWADSKQRLLSAIQKGRIIVDESDATITIALVSPIRLETGETLSDITFREPTASDLKVLDKYKQGEGMAKTIHLASKMSGKLIGVIERMGARDLQTMGAIAALFF